MIKQISVLVSIVVSILLFSGCDNYLLRKRMRRMISHSISLPDSLVKLYDGKKSYSSFSQTNNSTFIVFIDSTECGSCRATKMMRYCDLFKYQRERINTVIMFSPSKKQSFSLETALLNRRYPFPVYIDEKKSFYKKESIHS
ncbi:MAG: hypothetical protein J5939_01465 [Bacteroidales bacterium]|nr:hypothetical protein [Bacteroidales bacterium]